MKHIPKIPEASYDVAVVIGRWQLAHKGHETLFNRALAIAPKVVVVIGSAFKARDTRNPFTAMERQAQVLRCIAPQDRDRIQFVSVRDYYENDRWAARVRSEVGAHLALGKKVALVGFKKDQTSAYLNDFPEWQYEGVGREVNIDATPLRDLYFGTPNTQTALELMAPYVSQPVLEYLAAWRKLPHYDRLAKELEEVASYRKKWPAPWYMTADAVVRVSDHVLLIRRGGTIGQGLWALPGGFVNPNEQFLPAAIRELQEETQLGFLDSNLRQALKRSAVFDHALRSPRGRLVTQAFYFAYGDMKQLPEVHAADDAMEVRWVPISELSDYEDQMFEDHACILDYFVGVQGF